MTAAGCREQQKYNGHQAPQRAFHSHRSLLKKVCAGRETRTKNWAKTYTVVCTCRKQPLGRTVALA
jgi:hypothetical protein